MSTLEKAVALLKGLSPDKLEIVVYLLESLTIKQKIESIDYNKTNSLWREIGLINENNILLNRGFIICYSPSIRRITEMP